MPVRCHKPGEQRAASRPQEVARHRATDELALRRICEQDGLGGVELGPWEDLRRRHFRIPPDGDVEEAAVGVDQRLRDGGLPEPRVPERAAAVGQGERAEARDGARDSVGRGEVEQHGEAVGDLAADLVEGARGDGGGREAEAARHGARGRGVGEAKERGAELVVGREREGRGRGGGGGEREGVEELEEGWLGHAERVAPGGVRERGGGEEAEEPGGGQRRRRRGRGEREGGERERLEVEREQREEAGHGARGGEEEAGPAPASGTGAGGGRGRTRTAAPG